MYIFDLHEGFAEYILFPIIGWSVSGAEINNPEINFPLDIDDFNLFMIIIAVYYVIAIIVCIYMVKKRSIKGEKLKILQVLMIIGPIVVLLVIVYLLFQLILGAFYVPYVEIFTEFGVIQYYLNYGIEFG